MDIFPSFVLYSNQIVTSVKHFHQPWIGCLHWWPNTPIELATLFQVDQPDILLLSSSPVFMKEGKAQLSILQVFQEKLARQVLSKWLLKVASVQMT